MSGHWRLSAACTNVDPELFFGDQGGNPAPRIAAAKAVCAACPVRAACLAWALEHQPHGIAGGMTETERLAIGGVSGNAGSSARGYRAEHERREEGLRLLRAGHRRAAVAVRLGVAYTTVCGWWSATTKAAAS